jgi:hypothetical protein
VSSYHFSIGNFLRVKSQRGKVVGVPGRTGLKEPLFASVPYACPRSW